MSSSFIFVERNEEEIAVTVRGEVDRDEGRYPFLRSFESEIELTEEERDRAEEKLIEAARR